MNTIRRWISSQAQRFFLADELEPSMHEGNITPPPPPPRRVPVFKATRWRVFSKHQREGSLYWPTHYCVLFWSPVGVHLVMSCTTLRLTILQSKCPNTHKPYIYTHIDHLTALCFIRQVWRKPGVWPEGEHSINTCSVMGDSILGLRCFGEIKTIIWALQPI